MSKKVSLIGSLGCYIGMLLSSYFGTIESEISLGISSLVLIVIALNEDKE